MYTTAGCIQLQDVHNRRMYTTAGCTQPQDVHNHRMYTTVVSRVHLFINTSTVFTCFTKWELGVVFLLMPAPSVFYSALIIALSVPPMPEWEETLSKRSGGHADTSWNTSLISLFFIYCSNTAPFCGKSSMKISHSLIYEHKIPCRV